MTTPNFGYTLSSEEHSPSTLVANAQAAEVAGPGSRCGDLSYGCNAVTGTDSGP
jgi:hypothetical protein